MDCFKLESKRKEEKIKSKVEDFLLLSFDFTTEISTYVSSLSASQFLAVGLKPNYDHKLTCDVSFSIDEEKKVAGCCDKGDEYIFGEEYDYGKGTAFWKRASLQKRVERPFERNWMQILLSQAWFKFNLKARGNIPKLCKIVKSKLNSKTWKFS